MCSPNDQYQAQIIELFESLDPANQREIAEQLYETTVVGSFTIE
jgi:hypothetical protein